MESDKTLQQAPPDTQSDLASGMRRMADALRGLLVERDDNYDETEPHWNESADWQDFLASNDDKGGV